MSKDDDEIFEREERLQKQYNEWYEQQAQKAAEALEKGDEKTANKHYKEAQHYEKMHDKSKERQRRAASRSSSGGGCSLSLIMMILAARLAWVILKRGR